MKKSPQEVRANVAEALRKSTGMSRDEARDFINTYFERYPGIKRYIDETRQKQ